MGVVARPLKVTGRCHLTFLVEPCLIICKESSTFTLSRVQCLIVYVLWAINLNMLHPLTCTCSRECVGHATPD